MRTLAFNGSGAPAWIAQELVEGSWTLKDFLDELRAEDKTPEGYYRTVAELVASLAEGLEAAHQAGVIHRDLKPQNILIAPDDSPKLTDFGLARVTDDSFASVTGEFAGTYAYMSPEQVTAKRIGLDHRTDIFSLGVVLYELLSLRRPFEGDTTHQISQKILFFEPPEPSKVRSQCPRELSIICGKALEKDPDRRYATMAEFAADLRRHLADEPIHARPPGTLVRVVKWARRNPGPSSAAAVGTIALAVISGLLVKQVRTANDLEQRNAELRAASREDKLRGMIQDLAQLRAHSRTLDGLDRLGKPAYLWWIEESEKLLNGQEEDLERDIQWRPGLKDVQAKLAELRDDPSLHPYSDQDAARDFDSHPDRTLLSVAEAEPEALEKRLRDRIAALEGQVTVHALRLGKQTWPTESDVAAKYAKELEATDALQLNGDARRLVGPDATRQSAEDLLRAMLLAKRAVDLADAADKAMVRDTYAWSLVWLGRFDDALAQSAQAVAEAQGEMREQIAEGAERLRANAAKWTETERAARETELALWTVILEQRRASLGAEIAAQTSQLAPKLAALRARCGERRTWRFSDSMVEWNHNLLSTLEADLRWQEQMLAVAKEAAFSDKAKALWAEAIEGIAKAPNYAGQKWPSGERLTPQLGLLPLGENPVTGLWEFVHLQTGTEPALGADGRVLRDAEGRLTLTPETGMVFVLLPGGRVPKSTVDDGQRNCITQVDLDPFFISKYELSFEQWDRVSLRRGFQYQCDTSLVSANGISWDDATAMLQREVGWCRFPSEAQWEYGCRARTASNWWSGDEESDLAGVASLGELLPVGRLRANAFGLHEVHGNVWEWCGDTYSAKAAPRDGDGLRDDGVAGSAFRVLRSGSWYSSASEVRSASRRGIAPGYRDDYTGVRPSRCITP